MRKNSWNSGLNAVLWASVVVGCSLDASTEQGSDAGVVDVRPIETDERALNFGGTRTCYSNHCKCTEMYDDCMSDCFDRVPYLSYDCGGTCMDHWCMGSCDGDSSECGVYSYEFDPKSSNSSVVEACEQANEQERNCGENNVGDDCARAGVTESEDAVAIYECVATTSCEGDAQDCMPKPSSTFIDSACDEVGRVCVVYYCTSEWRELISRNEAWFSEAAMNAGYACLEEGSCRNVTGCLSSWSSALFGEMPTYVKPFDFQ